MKNLFDENQQKRLYALDEKGRERLFFKDKSTGIIIRDFLKKDGRSYYNAMLKDAKLSGEQLKEFLSRFERLAEERDSENDTEYSLAITTLTGKIIGIIDVQTESRELTGYTAYLKVFIKDNYVIKEKGDAVVDTIKDMHRLYFWNDAIFVKNEDDEYIPLEEAVA